MIENLPYLDSCIVFEQEIPVVANWPDTSGRLRAIFGVSEEGELPAVGAEIFVSGKGFGEGDSFVVAGSGASGRFPGLWWFNFSKGGAVAGLGFDYEKVWLKQSTFSIPHLAGKEVWVRADNGFIKANEGGAPLRVGMDGMITLPRSVGRAVIGLPYDSILETKQFTATASDEGSPWGLRRVVEGFSEVFGFPGTMRFSSGGSGSRESSGHVGDEIVRAKIPPRWRRRLGLRVAHDEPAYVAILSVGGDVEESAVPTAGRD